MHAAVAGGLGRFFGSSPRAWRTATGSASHRDIKPQNVLVAAEDGRLMLADFGLARQPPMHRGRPLTPEVVTLPYRAPELLLGLQVYDGFKLDVWALGCVLAECAGAACHPVFSGQSEVETLLTIFYRLGTPEDIPPWSELPHFHDRFPRWQGTGLDIPHGHVGDEVLRALTLDWRRRPRAADLVFEQPD